MKNPFFKKKEHRKEELRESYKGPILVKSVIVIILLLIAIPLSIATVSEIADRGEGYLGDKNDASTLRQADDRYYNREYFKLYDLLTLYKMDSAECEKHWELVNAYEDYIYVVQYHGAGIKEKEEEYRQKLSEDAASCKEPTNQNTINSFLEMAENL